MKIVMEYREGDGCTYSCTTTLPIEYESCEAALCDFENALNSVKSIYENFDFAGIGFHSDTFYQYLGMDNPRVYNEPEFMTIDEWFSRAK